MSYPIDQDPISPDPNQSGQQQYQPPPYQQPPPPQYQQPHYGEGDPPERNMAKMKSYEIAFVLTGLLYYLFWIPGFIVNIVMMNEGRRMEKMAGQALPGVGFLVIMFWLNIIGLILAVLFGIFILIVGVAAIPFLQDLNY